VIWKSGEGERLGGNLQRKAIPRTADGKKLGGRSWKEGLGEERICSGDKRQQIENSWDGEGRGKPRYYAGENKTAS